MHLANRLIALRKTSESGIFPSRLLPRECGTFNLSSNHSIGLEINNM